MAVSAVPRSVLITGCNRGIGLELVRQFLKHKTHSAPEILIATCRNPDKADELQAVATEHKNLHVLKLDVNDTDSFDGFVKSVGDIVGDANGLNLLVNNAGMLPSNRALDVVTPEDMMDAYKTNCIGPMFLTRALMPLLKTAAGAKDGEAMSIGRAAAVQMSTAVASIAENSGGGSYAYRCSKSGLNMAMKNLSIDLKGSNIMVMAMHPGWVLTDMGGPNALIDTTTCTSTMIDTFYALTEKDHGAFLRYNNTPIAW